MDDELSDLFDIFDEVVARAKEDSTDLLGAIGLLKLPEEATDHLSIPILKGVIYFVCSPHKRNTEILEERNK